MNFLRLFLLFLPLFILLQQFHSVDANAGDDDNDDGGAQGQKRTMKRAQSRAKNHHEDDGDGDADAEQPTKMSKKEKKQARKEAAKAARNQNSIKSNRRNRNDDDDDDDDEHGEGMGKKDLSTRAQRRAQRKLSGTAGSQSRTTAMGQKGGMLSRTTSWIKSFFKADFVGHPDHILNRMCEENKDKGKGTVQKCCASVRKNKQMGLHKLGTNEHLQTTQCHSDECPKCQPRFCLNLPKAAAQRKQAKKCCTAIVRFMDAEDKSAKPGETIAKACQSCPRCRQWLTTDAKSN